MKKTFSKWLTAVFAAVLVLALMGCGGNGDDEKDDAAKDRSVTINLFGGASKATVKGYMTKAELNGAADKIASRLNVEFGTLDGDMQNSYKDVFVRGVTYIVETNPDGYVNFKTVGDGKTIYIALSAIDTVYVIDGVRSIYPNGTYVSKVKNQDGTWMRGISLFEIAM